FSDRERDEILTSIEQERKTQNAKRKTSLPNKQTEGETEETAPDPSPTADELPEANEGTSKLPGVSIARYKGLGEMNPIQLWETTMNPATRTLLQVTIEDGERADELFSMLMGDEVPPRKRFIQTHAKTVKNLDI
ncbi:DNA topoisomerase IV subunit B, partial [Candidatus Berkelbacteria bacterium]|nr:DNA topoisomerase IV subunit B [Candidatus Berkelbacteria bacterium]